VAHPSLDLLQRSGVESVPAFSAHPFLDDQFGVEEHSQMLGYRWPADWQISG
jgi:hypothetical protein